MLDDDDEIADALDRLHAGGWSVGGSMFSGPGGLVFVEGWQRALDQAAAVGMLPGWPRPAM